MTGKQPLEHRVLSYLSTIEGKELTKLARCVNATAAQTNTALLRLKAKGLAARRLGLPGVCWYLASPRAEEKPCPR